MKKIASIPITKTGFLSNLMVDYVTQKESVEKLYHNFPNFEGFKNQIECKKDFPQEFRNNLVEVLQSQNSLLNLSEKSNINIQKLKNSNTFTVTTGHQLNLFTGPLYVIYKLLTTINLSEELKKQSPDNHFVPVYWMATEDHDFDEINHFYVHQNKLKWNKPSAGAVGNFDTEGLIEVYQEFKKLLGNQKNTEYIIQLFEKSYLNNTNLSEANRYLINELFGKYGLVILDGNNAKLKNQFKPFLIDELLHQQCEKVVGISNKEISNNYKIQVNPRAINLFYLFDNQRERILFNGNQFKINRANKLFSTEKILEEVENFPERFSPNVLMRPLYQEVILPNLCYVGGTGELAYWLQMKDFFMHQKVLFPILLPRISALILNSKQQEEMIKLQLSIKDILMPLPKLIDQKIQELSDINIDFSKERATINALFSNLEIDAANTDKSFIGAVKAQKKKQLNGLDKLEQRLLKAEKRKHQLIISKITSLYSELYPNGILQERVMNLSELLLIDENIIEELKKLFNSLNLNFEVLTIDN